jgi:cell division septal protein FtsQ
VIKRSVGLTAEGTLVHSIRQMSWSSCLRLWIVSLLATAAAAIALWLVWQRILAERAVNPLYQVQALIQTGPEVEALPSSYLMELLDLSQDHSPNLYALSLVEARDRLLRTPFIERAELSRVPPRTLQVGYAARQPMAICADLDNALVDGMGVLLPYQPFFRPRRLPKVFFGLTPQATALGKKLWGRRLGPDLIQITREVLQEPIWGHIELIWADFSHAIDLDPSSAEIVIQCLLSEASSQPIWIRLAPDRWKDGLHRLKAMIGQPSILEQIEIVDLRLGQMAILHPRADLNAVNSGG